MSDADRRYLSKLVPDTEAETKKKFNSMCDQSMVGFVQHTDFKLDGDLDNQQITCFYAQRDQSNLDDALLTRNSLVQHTNEVNQTKTETMTATKK